jgi:hypothetical protein
MTGVAVRHVQRDIRALSDAGCVRVDQNAGPKRSNRFYFLVPTLAETATPAAASTLAETATLPLADGATPGAAATATRSNQGSNQGSDHLPADAETETPRALSLVRSPRRTPSESDLAAYAIRDAAWRTIEDRHGASLGSSEGDWKKRNKVGADVLHRAGRTPEEVAAMLRVAYDDPVASKYHGAITRLDVLADRWTALSRFAATSASMPRAVGDMDAQLAALEQPHGGAA